MPGRPIFTLALVNDETEQAEDYRGILTEGVDRGLTMVCANPDVIVIRGGRTIPCAGAVAALYEELGGTVQRFGKPFPDIFDRLFAESPEIPRARAVMIGDGLPTDIRGASGGIHADALAMGPDGRLQPDKVHAVAEQAGERPKTILPWLNW
jgi:HAD superfamily hydrolase (TIGR01459 family)